MDGRLPPLGTIERYVGGEDGRVGVDVDKVGRRFAQIDQHVLALPSGLDKAGTELFNRVIHRDTLVLHLHVLEEEVAQEALILKERVDLVRFVPNEQVLALLVCLIDLLQEVWNAVD